MGPIDIAVAGCGPAGLATALLLHRDGHRVTMFERFDAPKPIGSGLMMQPTGMSVLMKLGLSEQLSRQGARIDRLVGRTANGRSVLDVHYRSLGQPGRFGIGVHRAALFAILFDEIAAAGISIETGRTIFGSERTADGRRKLLFERGAPSAPFDLIVDTLGTQTPLAPPTGRQLSYGALWASLDWPDDPRFDPTALEQHYRAASKMAGVMPIGIRPGSATPQAAFFWSLRVDQFERWKADGLTAWKQEVLALWPMLAPLLDQIESPDRLTFARYAHRTLAKPADVALIHLGDAWHSASPQLGQGANMAMLDAYALALALRHSDDLDTAIGTAVALRKRHVQLYQALTAILTPVYQSDGRFIPWLRDWLVGPMSRIPPIPRIQALLVSGLVGAPLRKLAL